MKWSFKDWYRAFRHDCKCDWFTSVLGAVVYWTKERIE